MRSIIKKRWGLTVSLVVFIFLILLVTMALVGGLFIILHHTGVLDFFDGTRLDIAEVRPESPRGFPFPGVLSMLFFSAFLGTVIAWFFSKIALRPIRKVIDATRKVADGDLMSGWIYTVFMSLKNYRTVSTK